MFGLTAYNKIGEFIETFKEACNLDKGYKKQLWIIK